MKHFLILPLLLLNLFSSAQEWKERYVTAGGDTIKIGSKIALGSPKIFHSVYPSPFFVSNDNSSNINKTGNSGARLTKYRDYLHQYMKGDTIKITRLTRTKEHGEYKQKAAFEKYDEYLSHYTAEYYIDIEDALKTKEIEIIKPIN